MALCQSRISADACAKTLTWIGEYAITPADTSTADPQWTKSLALLTLRRLNALSKSQQRLEQDLLQIRVQQAAAADGLDGKLQGWAWVDNTFSWVEPTSYALLALKSAGHGTHPRVQEAERLLLNRVCDDGGWNYGNRIARDAKLTSMMPTTALAAMALQGVTDAKPVVERAMALLDREARARPSTLSLALTTLCFSVFSRPTNQLLPLLVDRQNTEGSWRHQVHLTALSALALQAAIENRNVFRI